MDCCLASIASNSPLLFVKGHLLKHMTFSLCTSEAKCANKVNLGFAIYSKSYVLTIQYITAHPSVGHHHCHHHCHLAGSARAGAPVAMRQSPHPSVVFAVPTEIRVRR